MFASDLKIISLTPKDVITTCKNDNTSPMIKYPKQHNVSQKYQNVTQHHNNVSRKKLQKGNTNNNSSCNTKVQNPNSQAYTTNNRKKINQQLNINFNIKTYNNNSNTSKDQNIYIPTSVSNNIVIKNSNNKCNDSNLLPPNVEKNSCGTFANQNIVSEPSTTTSTFPKSSALVSSSLSLSSSVSTTTNSINTKQNQSGSNLTHRKKAHQSEVDTINKKKSLSPIPLMVIGNNSSNNQQMSGVITSPVVSAANVIPSMIPINSSSAPVSPNSYSLDFLHSVGVQMTGSRKNHIYSNSAAVSPSHRVVETHNMIVQGHRLIYQDLPPTDKRSMLDHGQNKYNSGPKLLSPCYTEYPSYDIPILINNPHHPGVNSINTHMPSDSFPSPYNYPPLNNYKRNSYIPTSYTYQKCQSESKPDSNSVNGNNTANTPTYNRNRNQVKVWNTSNSSSHKNGSNINAKNTENGSGSNHLHRGKNHQNIHNLTYVTTDPNNNRYSEKSRSQSSSPSSENPIQIRNKMKGNDHKTKPFNQTQITVKSSDSQTSSTDGITRVVSDGYESDSSSSSSGNVKKVEEGHTYPLSSSSSSISSVDIPFVPSPLHCPINYAEDDLILPHFYGSEQNLSHWIPALHAQFLYSAHGAYVGNESPAELQHQMQIKKSQSHRNSFRGARGRHFLHNNVRSVHFTNDFLFTPPDRFLARSHLVEIKEIPRGLLTCSKYDNLSQGIWNKFVSSQQTEDTYKRKMRLWRFLYVLVKNSYPRYGLYLVGSTISGFGADTSDIDMCLVSRAISTIDPRMEALFNLTLLRDCLSKTGEFENFNLIEAKVPILRFKDKVHNLEVDLNFNNCVGIKNTHLLYCYSQLDWRLRPLVLVTKLWAQYHNINNAKHMTISSYSLVLMVIHFLQCAVSPPVLPCLHEMYPDKFQFILRSNDFGYVDMNETIGPYESQNTLSIGQLFLQFLQYYSSFNYSQFAISIRTGSLIPIEYCRQAKSLKNDIHQWKELCIEEPFDLTNTARSVYDFETFERVKLVFIMSYRVLQETLDINSIFSPLIPTSAASRNEK